MVCENLRETSLECRCHTRRLPAAPLPLNTGTPCSKTIGYFDLVAMSGIQPGKKRRQISLLIAAAGFF